VFVLDALGAIASRRFNFNYARLAPLSFIIYAAIGLIGTVEADQDTGIILAAAIGFFDATIGWKTCMVLKANTGKADNNPTVSRWIITAIFVTLLAAVCGVVGSELSNVFR
jgi:hypothetical protein